MKLNKIKALCVDKGFCYLADRGDDQLIGPGEALYSTDCVAIATTEIPGLFDMDKKQQKKMKIQELPGLNFGTEVEELKPSMMTVKGSEEFVPLKSKDGIIYFIRAKHAEAARGKAGYRHFFLRIRKDGSPIISITDGISAPCAFVAPIEKGRAEILMREMEAIGTGTPGRTAPDRMKEMPDSEQQTSMLDDAE